MKNVKIENVTFENVDLQFVNQDKMGIIFPDPVFGQAPEKSIRITKPTGKKEYCFSGQILLTKREEKWEATIPALSRINTEAGNALQLPTPKQSGEVFAAIQRAVESNIIDVEAAYNDVSAEIIEAAARAKKERKIQELNAALADSKKALETLQGEKERITLEIEGIENLINEFSEALSEIG
jgi:vacuolar-type H+-ATPase subunit I/STV1